MTETIQDVITAIELYDKRVISLEDLTLIAGVYYKRMYGIKFTGLSYKEEANG